MGLDYRTVVIKGWKVADRDKVTALISELESWDEDYYDHMDGLMVEDTMCGNYFYFGALLVYQDAVEGEESIITDRLIKEKTKKWEDFIEKNPKFLEIVKYVGIHMGEPQIYVFQHIW